MGWASGSSLMSDIVQVIHARKDTISDEVRKKIYEELITAFEGHDCDTLWECRGIDPVYDQVIDARYPSD